MPVLFWIYPIYIHRPFYISIFPGKRLPNMCRAYAGVSKKRKINKCARNLHLIYFLLKKDIRFRWVFLRDLLLSMARVTCYCPDHLTCKQSLVNNRTGGDVAWQAYTEMINWIENVVMEDYSCLVWMSVFFKTKALFGGKKTQNKTQFLLSKQPSIRFQVDLTNCWQIFV